jgi:glycosyltransferase involved in cell wall biosynthesis
LNQPKISAILPCYNHAAFLEERIKSVLDQTLPVSQIIFLDDASTDGSLELARKLLADTPAEVEFHSNTCNSGSPFAQWNKGLRLAKYPYVWIAETDDICSPDLLAKLCTKMSSSGAVIAFSQSRYIDESGTDLGSALGYTNTHWPGLFGQDFLASGSEFNSKFMTVINVIPNASAVLFKRRALASTAAANEAMNYCGDWDFWTRIAEQGHVAFVAEELNGFRCHQQTTRHKHHTPQATAEFLACRLRAQIPSEGTSEELNLQRLMQLLRRQDRYIMGIAPNSLDWRNFKQVYASYRRLDNVPCVSMGAWVIIALTSFKIHLWQKILKVRNLALCVAKKLMLRS